MIQNIQMTQVSCDYLEHQGQFMSSLCTNSRCKAISACCKKCLLKFHKECNDHIVFLEEVPGMFDTIFALEKFYEDFTLGVNLILKDIKKSLDCLLYSIKEHFDSPNLRDLIFLGNMLRSKPTESVPTLIGETQKLISDELTKLLLNIQSIELKILLKEPSQNQNNEAQKLCEESKDWYEKDNYIEALNCIESAIQLDPNNEKYLSRKGCCLSQLRRHEDAIESYNKSISIKPTSDAYYLKASSLSKLSRLQEVINCDMEGLTEFPNNPSLIFQMNRYQSKLKLQ